MSLTKLLKEAKENNVNLLQAKDIYEKVNYRIYHREINKIFERGEINEVNFSTINPELEEKTYKITKRYLQIYKNAN